MRKRDRPGAGMILWTVWAMVFWIASAMQLSATRMVPLSVEQLAGVAGVVVHARVESVAAARDKEGRVFTRIGLRRIETWKGRMETGSFEIVAGGGVLGDREVRVVGQAVYAVGEEVVAFLVRNPDGEWVTVGLSQGRFSIWRDAASGQRYAVRPVVSGHDSPAAARDVEAAVLRSLTLEELKRRTQETSR